MNAVATQPLLPDPVMFEPSYVARIEQRMQRLEDALLLAAGVPASSRADVTVGDVVTWVAFQTGISAAEITGQRRLFALARARFAVYWLGVHALQLSLPQIGKKLSARDHTTVLHGIRRAAELREVDPAFRMMTDKGLRHFVALIADAIIKASESVLANSEGTAE
jgi:chromosomal replication initiation ATPase DnaA